MELVKHETCQQYVARRLSEGWKIVSERGYHLILSSPDGNILRPVDLRNDVETLRPNADTAQAELDAKGAGSHYVEVDEVTADEDTTYVECAVSCGPVGCGDDEWDLYDLPAHSAGSGTINHVTVYIRCRRTGSTTGIGQVKIKTHDTVYSGDEENLAVWTSYSKQWTENPNQSAAWTWDEIDALQIGIRLTANQSAYQSGETQCTQVYVEVDYVPINEYEKALTEAISLADSIVKNPAKPLADVASIADSLIRSSGRSFSDVTSLADTMQRTTGKVISDVVSIAEVFARVTVIKRAFTEAITVTGAIDIIAEGFKKLEEVITVGDVVVRKVSKAFTESITLVDTIARVVVWKRTFTNALSILDSRISKIKVFIADALAVGDSIQRSTAKTITNTLSLADTMARASAISFLETLSLVETFIRGSGRSFLETVTLVDTFARTAVTKRALSDAFLILDTEAYKIKLGVSDALSLADSLVRKAGKALSDVLSVIEEKWCLSFDGDDDQVSCPDTPSLDMGTSDFTLEIWAKITDTDVYRTLIQKNGWSNGCYFFMVDTNGALYIYLKDTDGTGDATDSIANAVSMGSVVYLVAAVDRSDKVRLYVNGSEVTYSRQPDISGWGSLDNDQPLLFGAYANKDHKGDIYQIRLSKVVRTAAEINAAYNRGKDAPLNKDAHTVGLWLMNEGTGSTAYDETVNNNDGTITGATWLRCTTLLVKATSKAFAAALTVVDSLSRTAQYHRAFANALSVVDTLASAIKKGLGEVITLVESFARKAQWKRALEEAITVLDTSFWRVRLVMSDVLTIVDTVAKGTWKGISDAVAIADSIVKATSKTLTTSLTVMDTISTALTKFRDLSLRVTMHAHRSVKVIMSAYRSVKTLIGGGDV